MFQSESSLNYPVFLHYIYSVISVAGFCVDCMDNSTYPHNLIHGLLYSITSSIIAIL